MIDFDLIEQKYSKIINKAKQIKPELIQPTKAFCQTKAAFL